MKRQASSKILRHELAKEKYKEFENVRTQQQFQTENLKVPQPGQFFIQPTKSIKLTLNMLQAERQEIKQKRPVSSNCMASTVEADPDFGVTRNLKVLVNRQNTRLLSPTSKVITEIVDRRVQKQCFSPQNVRPISAQLFTKLQKLQIQTIDNCQILTKAYDFDKKQILNTKKPSTFVVKHRKRVIKHINGYNTVILNRQDIESTKDIGSKISPYLTTNNITLQEKEKKKQVNDAVMNFLPLEYYMLDDPSPQQLLSRYKPKDGKCYAYSKWFDNSGLFKWKRCIINRFDADSQRWAIAWTDNINNQKMVSRCNLRFELQNREQFHYMLHQAEEYRKSSEIFYRYNYMIDLMRNPTSQLPVLTKQRILSMVKGMTMKITKCRNPVEFNKLTFQQKFKKYYENATKYELVGKCNSIKSANLSKMVMEIQSLYVRTNHQIEFNNTLPYSEQRRLMFGKHLPKYMFQSILETPAPETNRKGCLPLTNGDKPTNFITTYTKFSDIAHIANQQRLRVLNLLRLQQLQLEKLSAWITISQAMTVDRLDIMWMQQINQVLHQINVKSCDSEHEIGMQLDPVFLERKYSLSEEQTAKLLNQVSRFQFLINLRYQLLLRKLYEKTLNEIIGSLEKTLHGLTKPTTLQQIVEYLHDKDFSERPTDTLCLFVEYKLDGGQLVSEPSDEKIRQTFIERQSQLTDKLMNIRTIDKSYLEPARNDRRMKILPVGDKELIKLRLKYHDSVESVIICHQIYRNSLENLVREIQDYNVEQKKKMLRKGNYNDFQIQLNLVQSYLVSLDIIILPRRMNIGIFSIDATELKKKLKQRITDISNEVYKLLIERIKKDNEKVTKIIETIIMKLTAEPTSIEEMTEQQDYAEKRVMGELESVYEKINSVMQKMDLLSALNYRLEYEDFQESWQIYSKPLRVKQKQQKCLRIIENTHKKTFSEGLQKDCEDLLHNIHEIGYKFQCCTIFSKTSEIDQASAEMAKLYERIEQAISQSELINKREGLMQWKLTDFGQLHTIKNNFMPYYQVWTLARHFNCTIPNLIIAPFQSIDKKLITEEIQSACEELGLFLKNEFKNNPKMIKLTQEVRDMYNGFRHYLPLINGLRNADLRQRHWERIAEVSGIPTLGQSYIGSLQNLIDAGLLNKLQQLLEVSEIATKQLSFEKMFNKLKKDWREVKVIVKEQEPPVVQDLEPLLQKIDNDIVKVQVIVGSPFVKFLQSEVIQWRNAVLYRAQELFEYFNRVQQLWQTLQPIFLTKNIDKDLPNDYERYLLFDKNWRNLLQQIAAGPLVTDIIQTKTRQTLTFMQDNLENMLRNLSQLFNLKRDIFARFYFLSNDQMLQIYSQAKSYNHLKKSLRLCFDSAEDLEAEENPDSVVVKTILSKNQRLPLLKQVVLHRQTPVQEQFQALDRAIVESLKYHLDNLFKHNKVDIKQLVALENAILWTDATAKAITQGTVEELLLVYTAKIEQNSQIIRKQSCKSQSTAGMLILQLLYQRDVLQNIYGSHISSLSSFNWNVQLRNYYNGKECTIRILNQSRRYGFEYLGLREKIAITPITQRCMRSLFYSLDSGQLGCIQGPSLSGKTQTVAEMAHIVGKRFIVLNCSKTTDLRLIVKVFQGMCTSGSWVCYKNFNNLEVECLAVLASLVSTLQQQQLSSTRNFVNQPSQSSRMKSAMIQEKNCIIESSYGIIFTNTLSDNRTNSFITLKGILRPITIVNPHNDIIISCLLASLGFPNCLELSEKILGVLKMCSQFLVQRPQYCFGLATVIKIFRMVRQIDDSDQFCRVNLSLRKVIEPFLIEDDRKLLQDFINQYFPEDSNPGIKQLDQQNIYRDAFQFKGFILSDKMAQGAAFVEECVKTNICSVIVGKMATGKSTIIECLSDLNSAKLYKIYPKATKPINIFGSVTSEGGFNQGYLSKIVKNDKGKKWVCFDGDIDNEWSENLTPLMYDYSYLTLSNGEKLRIEGEIKLLFETDSLESASPAFLAKCGKVYLQQKISVDMILRGWLAKLPNCLSKQAYFYGQLIKYLLEPMLTFVLANRQDLDPCTLVSSFIRLFQGLRLQGRKDTIQSVRVIQLPTTTPLATSHTLKGRSNKDLSGIPDSLKSQIFGRFIFAVVWSLGSCLDKHSRKAFSKEFKHLCNRTIQLHLRQVQKHATPSDDIGLFEAVFDGQDWSLWTDKRHLRIEETKSVLTSVQNVRNEYLLRNLVENGHSVCLFGDASSGKNTSIEYFLSSLNKLKFIKTTCSFSNDLSLNQTIEIFERRLEKQRRSMGCVGPFLGKTSIIYINDLQMAKRDTIGSRPALQVMRQWLQMGGWIDTKGFKKVQDIVFCASCSKADRIPAKMFRLMNSIYSNEDNQWPIGQIKQNLLISINNPELVDSLIKISFNLQNILSKEFKPQPGLEHIRFGFKQTLQILNNVGNITNQPSSLSEQRQKILKSWIDECNGTYLDRLIDQDHQSKLYYSMNNVLLEQFGLRYRQIQQEGEPRKILSSLNEENIYREMLYEEIEQYLKGTSCGIILYEQTVKIATKLVRSLSQNYGYASVLIPYDVGMENIVKGIGKLLEYKVFMANSCDMEIWKETLRLALKESNQKPCVLHVQTDKVSTWILSQLNSFMKIGTFTTSLDYDDIECLVSDIRPTYNASQLYDIWGQELEICRKNLRLAVSIKTKHNDYRNWLRDYSAFMDRTTVVFVKQLSHQAIKSILHLQNDEAQLLSKCLINLNHPVNPQKIQQLSSAYTQFKQKQIEKINKQFDTYDTALRRITSIDQQLLEFQTANSTINKQRQKNNKDLEEAHKQTQSILTIRNQVQAKYQESQTQINKKFKIASDYKKQCEDRLSNEVKSIINAVEEIKQMDGKDNNSILKYLKTASSSIKLTLELTFILVEKKKKQQENWKELLKDLADSNSKAIKKISSMDPNNLNERTMDRMKMMADKNIRDLALSQKQPRIFRLLNFLCVAVIRFYQSYKALEPLRNKMAEAIKNADCSKPEHSELMVKLSEVTDNILKQQSLIDRLKEEKSKFNERQQQIVKQIELLKETKDLFKKQLGLWAHNLEIIEKKRKQIIGHSVLSAFTVLFLSHLPYEQRVDVRQKVLSQAIAQMGHQTPQIFNMSDQPDSQDISNQQNYAILSKLPKNVYLYDPERQMQKHLLATNESVFSIIHQKQLLSRQQQILIIHEGRPQINQAYRNYISSESVKFHKRLIMLCRKPHSYVYPLLNCQSRQKSLKEDIMMMIMKQEEPGQEDQVKKVLQESLDLKTKQQQLHREILKILSQWTSLSSLSLNIEAYQHFLQTKHELDDVTLRIREAKYAEQRTVKNKYQYQECSNIISQLYFSTNKMTHVNFSVFQNLLIKLIKSLQKQQQKNSKTRIQHLEKIIKKYFYQYLSMWVPLSALPLWNYHYVGTMTENKEMYADIQNVGSSAAYVENGRITKDGIDFLNQLKYKNGSLLQCIGMKSIYEYLNSKMDYLGTMTQTELLLLLKIFYPEKFEEYLSTVAQKISESSCFSVEQIDKAIWLSTPMTPIIINTEENIIDEILRLAQEASVDPYVMTANRMTLGKLKEKLQSASEMGGWLIVQNVEGCEEAQKMVEKVYVQAEIGQKRICSDFRLFLINAGDSIGCLSTIVLYAKWDLQSCVLQSYKRRFSSKNDRKMYNNASADSKWRQMFFSLAVLHATIRYRNVHPGGWQHYLPLQPQMIDQTFKWLMVATEQSIQEQMTAEELRAVILSTTYGTLPWTNYDRNLMRILLNRFVCSDAWAGYEYGLATDGKWRIPPSNMISDIDQTIQYIKDHIKNRCQFIEISRHHQVTTKFELDLAILQQIIADCHVDPANVRQRLPLTIKKPIHTFLVCQIDKFARLLNVIRKSFVELHMFMKSNGPEPSSYSQIRHGLVPKEWQRFSYPSEKSIVDFLQNLKNKIDHMHQLILGSRMCYQLGNYFNPQALLTAIQQIYCQQQMLDMEEVGISMKITDKYEIVDLEHQDETSIYVSGLYLQQASWSKQTVCDRKNTENRGILMPIVHFKAELKQNMEIQSGVCGFPVYREKTMNKMTVLEPITEINLNNEVNLSSIVLRNVCLTCQP